MSANLYLRGLAWRALCHQIGAQADTGTDSAAIHAEATRALESMSPEEVKGMGLQERDDQLRARLLDYRDALEERRRDAEEELAFVRGALGRFEELSSERKYRELASVLCDDRLSESLDDTQPCFLDLSEEA